MVFGPLMERELRVRSRQWRTWSWRSGLVAAGCLAWIVGVMVGRLSTTSGKPALGVISIFPFVFVLFSGALLTADSVSREKRDGTLGLLFLTALKPGEIIRQKMLAAGANSLLSLVAITPLFALPVALGGVTGTEVATLMCLLVVTFFWSCSIGSLVSV